MTYQEKMVLVNYLGGFKVCHSDLYGQMPELEIWGGRERGKLWHSQRVLAVCYSPGQ
jgi:hypothetical protein